MKDGPIRLSDLAKHSKQTDALLSREIKSINKVFKKKLELIDDAPYLIDHSNSNGYFLNKENYIFESDLD